MGHGLWEYDLYFHLKLSIPLEGQPGAQSVRKVLITKLSLQEVSTHRKENTLRAGKKFAKEIFLDLHLHHPLCCHCFIHDFLFPKSL